jgi:hypothetical protein
MTKIKLFRKGRYVGIVKENFHRVESTQEKTNTWNNLGINNFNF